MFTGLVEEVGRVTSIRERERSKQLQIVAPRTAKKIRTGDSVAVNGCCLTLSAHRGDRLTFDLLEETLDRTNLKMLRGGSSVNLERALRADGRFGGHFVQGHVDCASRIINFEQRRGDRRLEVELPAEFARYVACKGSIAIDGISLTVAGVKRSSFRIWIIPHTYEITALRERKVGDAVNLEADLLGKYVEKFVTSRSSG